MELKAGYKLTNVGLIPKDWEVINIGDIVEFANGKPYESKVTPNGAYDLITLDSIGIDGQLKSEHRRIDFFDNSLQKDDIVIILSDLAHGNLLGLCDLIHSANQYVLNQRVGRLRVVSNTDPQYVRLQINFRQTHFKKRGQGTSQRHIYKRDIAELLIPLPQVLEEQRAIAAALSDVDALISSLDKLIAKKRDIKTAAMQQLLTGKTRLPGFSGKWEVKRIGELLEYEQPVEYLVKDTEYSDNNSIPVLTAGKTFILGYTNEQKGVYRDLPVVIFDDFTTANRYVDFPFKVKSSAIKLLKTRNDSADLRFLFGKMQTMKFALGDHKRYYISEYQYNEIDVPSPEEQTAIAAVLSDMDAEIAALEGKRDKARALKQGMMQELLTGRIRLI